MRLLVLSDIHLEFESFDIPEDLDFDVAIFAGDTWKPPTNAIRWLSTQRDGPLNGKPIVCISGNHEYYGYELTSAREEGRKLAQSLGINLLDPGTAIIGGVRFIGATLWTDFALLARPIAAKQYAQREMNDYRRIRIAQDGKKRLLRPQDTASLHRQDRSFIEASLAQKFDGPTVVVTHHAPHRNSVAPEFQRDPLSPAYCSDLSEIIMKYQPALWVHGHDHRHHDYAVGNTRIVANPAGYPMSDGRENKKFDPYFIVQV